MNYVTKRSSIVKNCIAACSTVIFAATPAFAASTIASFPITASVITSCALTTPAALSFGNYSPSNSSALTTSTAFSVVCTIGTAYSLGLDAGLSTGASVTTRKMTSSTATSGNNLLAYGLFKDTSGTNWDNNQTAAGYTATGLVQAYTIHGAIPSGQYAVGAATNYTDTIVLTLTY